MIYLDHAASTPCDPRVLSAMLPFFGDVYGNPSSGHGAGREARSAVEDARRRVAALLGAEPDEIVWTAGASESDNLAIKGATRARARAAPGAPGRGHVITSAIEHKAVLKPCRRLEREGFELTVVRPGRDGIVTAAIVEEAMRDDTLLVSIIAASNEIGTLAEIDRIGALCRSRDVLFHTDATQMVGLLPIDVGADRIDLLSLSGHKIGGPKGVGALYVRRGVELEPMIEGGSHEAGRRAGTLNVPGIVGLGRACEICSEVMDEEASHHSALRDRLEAELSRRVEGVVVNGDRDRRVPHISSLCFTGVPGVPVIEHVEAVACSSGSAVDSAPASRGGRTPSHVLQAIGVPDELAVTALRVSLGRTTIQLDVDAAVDHVVSVVERLKCNHRDTEDTEVAQRRG